MTIQVGPARVVSTLTSVKVLHGDKVLLHCGDRRRAGHYAQGYNRGYAAGKAEASR